MQRRTFVQAGTALLGGVTIAGCSDGGDPGGDGNGSSADEGEVTAGNEGDESAGNGTRAEGRPPGGDTEAGTDSASKPPNVRWYDSETGVGVLDEVAVDRDGVGNMYIRGTAQNFAETDYSHVQLSFTFYNRAGVKLTDALANVGGLGSGEQWQFEALAPSTDDAETYTLTDVTAY